MCRPGKKGKIVHVHEKRQKPSTGTASHRFWQEEQEDDRLKETDGLNDTHGDEDDETLTFSFEDGATADLLATYKVDMRRIGALC